MATLAQLLASHECILAIDAASGSVQVGLLRRGGPPHWARSEEESGKAIFTCTAACLAAAGAEISAVRAFAFCEGPGSMLGVRTAAMAIRTWQVEESRPAYRYPSLPLLALGLHRAGNAAPFAVLADARREAWHCAAVREAGGVPTLQRLTAAEIAASDLPLFLPSAFRAWTRPPREARDCAYDVATLLAGARDAEIFRSAPTPEPLQFAPPEYRKWSAQVHSAATAPRP